MKTSVIVPIVLSILCFAMISCGTKTQETASSQVENDEATAVQTTPSSSVDINKRGTLTYKVIWENHSVRYDNAPTFVIVTDQNSHEHMHNLVDEFARKIATKKFTLIAFDEEEAAQVYKSSHYGANEVNRIATKAELKLMDKHVIGMYNGELDTNVSPYEILYHCFSLEKESTEEYEPQL